MRATLEHREGVTRNVEVMIRVLDDSAKRLHSGRTAAVRPTPVHQLDAEQRIRPATIPLSSANWPRPRVRGAGSWPGTEVPESIDMPEARRRGGGSKEPVGSVPTPSRATRSAGIESHPAGRSIGSPPASESRSR